MMQRRSRLVSAALTLLFTAGLFAQAKPNFAGKWTQVVDPNATAAAGGRGGRGGGFGLGMAFSATQDDKTLTVTTTGPNGDMKAAYNLDGSDSKNPITFNGTTIDRVSKVKWDGAKLVITTTTNFNGTANESTQSWSLDATGNLIVEATMNFGGNGPTTTKSTYKKG